MAANPGFGFLNLTMDCNNRCKWCYASPGEFSKKTMPQNKVKEYLDLFKSFGMKDVGYIGGEPTLYPQLFEMIKEANSRGMRVTIYTNGRKLSDEEYVNKLKESGVYKVQIDVHSTDPNKHDSITQIPGSYSETMKGIENCQKADITMRFLSVLYDKDFRTYKDIIDKFVHMNTPFVFFREIPPVTNLKADILSNKKTAKLVEEIYNYSKEVDANVSFYLRMPLCWFEPRLVKDMIKRNSLENYCHTMNGNSLNIDVNGDILPCLHFVGYPMFNVNRGMKVMGKEKFLEKWASKSVMDVRKKLRGYPSKECVNCNAYGIYCRGGCPLLKFELGTHHDEYHK